MLIHVENEDRGRINRRLRVIRGDQVPEPLRRPGVRQRDPAGPTGEGLSRPHELPAPGPDTPEVLLEGGRHWIRNLVPFPTQVAEVQLVQRDGAHCRQLFALKGAELVVGRSGIEVGELVQTAFNVRTALP